MAQTYPYYVPAKVYAGQMQKLFREKKYKTCSEAAAAFQTWANNHPNVFNTNQFVILEYTNTYDCKILGIYTNGTYLYVDKTCEPKYF